MAWDITPSTFPDLFCTGNMLPPIMQTNPPANLNGAIGEATLNGNFQLPAGVQGKLYYYCAPCNLYFEGVGRK